MKRRATFLIFLLFFLVCVRPVSAQSQNDIEELKKEIDALKENQKVMQKDIQEIKNLLRARQEPEFKEASIDLGDNPFKGDKNAKFIIAEFSDYQ